MTKHNPNATDSVSDQAFKNWAAAGNVVPLQYKGREHVWHKKVAKFAAGGEVYNTVPDMKDGGDIIQGPAYARGGEVRMQKGGKLGVGMKLADIVSDVSKQADEILAAKKAASKLEDALKAQQAPMAAPHGTGLPLMPRSQGMYTPGVPQVDLPRMAKVDKARAEGKSPAYTERMQDLLDSPTARKKVDKLINQGKELGMQEWYGTEPLRQVAMDAGLSPDEFKTFIAQMASASQRNPVDQQNKMGSYLHYLSKTGQLPEDAFLLTNKIKKDPSLRPEGTAIELPEGYGSLAQGDIFSRGKQIAFGDIEGALPPDKKLGTFYRNYLGNLRPVTVDVNAVRGPIIERGDPRWLASKLVEKDEDGNIIATHFPRKDVAEGRMSLKEAKDRPGFWEAAPSGSEYAGFEDLWQRGAKRHDVSPAEAQALGWYGSADVTALKTKPELYIDNLERMIRRTAEETGQHPLQVMDDVIKGKGYLYKEGGEVHKADGGKIAKGMMGALEKASKAADAQLNAGSASAKISKEVGMPTGIKSLSFEDYAPNEVELVNLEAIKKGQGYGSNAMRKIIDSADQNRVNMMLIPAGDEAKRARLSDFYSRFGFSEDGDVMRRAYKRASGGLIREQHFDGGGMAAADFVVGEDDGGNLDKAKLMAKILADMAKEQGSKEVSSLKKPRAVTDLLNRGVLANNPLSAGVDLFNMGLGAVGLGSEKPFLGSEHVKDLMDRFNVTSGEDRPMMETALSFASPTALIKGAMKAPGAAKKVTEALTSSKIAPSEAKTAQAGKPTGASYATRQEGPFYRVIPSALDQSTVGARGVREAAELQAQGAIGAGPSSTGQRVPKQFSDEEVAGLISSPTNKARKLAQDYTKEQRGSDFVTPDMPASSLAKQSAIGRTHMAAVEGTPAYKHQGMANPKASKPMAIMFDQTPVQRHKRGGLSSIK